MTQCYIVDDNVVKQLEKKKVIKQLHNAFVRLVWPHSAKPRNPFGSLKGLCQYKLHRGQIESRLGYVRRR